VEQDQRMILVVGEALVDVVERPDGSRSEHVGGSPTNVAVGLGRAGLDVSLATVLGDDPYGELIRRHLAESQVDVLASSTDRTASAVARLDDHGSASYEFDISWDPGPIEPAALPDAVHTGSIAATLAPGADEVATLVQRLRATSIVTFDPNVRPSLTPDRDEVAVRVERIVRLADVVKVSDEDLAWLYPGVPFDDVTMRWLDGGASLVVVTRGGKGSVARARSGRLDTTVPSVDVVDTVGAGDAYMSGLIVAVEIEGLLDVSARARLQEIDADTTRRLIDTAARSAAIVVGRAGADPPSRAELLD
jgi:fructokinase